MHILAFLPFCCFTVLLYIRYSQPCHRGSSPEWALKNKQTPNITLCSKRHLVSPVTEHKIVLDTTQPDSNTAPLRQAARHSMGFETPQEGLHLLCPSRAETHRIPTPSPQRGLLLKHPAGRQLVLDGTTGLHPPPAPELCWGQMLQCCGPAGAAVENPRL